jgi:tRNA(Arg) A34 adenosine deaminase TadA
VEDATPVQQECPLHEAGLGLRGVGDYPGQTPFGAVVVDRDGRLIGQGHNTVRADLDPPTHGEMVAIRAAWRRVGTR